MGQGVGTAAVSPGPKLPEEQGHLGTRGPRKALAGIGVSGSHGRGTQGLKLGPSLSSLWAIDSGTELGEKINVPRKA